MAKAKTSPFFPWHWHRLEVLLQSVVSNGFVVLSGLGLKLSSAFSVSLLFYPSIIMCSEMVADLQVQAWEWACMYALNTNNCVFPFCVTPLSVLAAALELRGSSNPISLSEEGTGSWWLCSDVASTCIIIFGGITVYLNGLWSWILAWFVFVRVQWQRRWNKIAKEMYISWKASVAVLEFLCHSYILIRLKFLATYLRPVCQCNNQLLALDRTLLCVYIPAHTGTVFSL